MGMPFGIERLRAARRSGAPRTTESLEESAKDHRLSIKTYRFSMSQLAVPQILWIFMQVWSLPLRRPRTTAAT